MSHSVSIPGLKIMETASLLLCFVFGLCWSSSCGSELSRKQATINQLYRIYKQFYKQSQNAATRIAGGTKADRKEYPWYSQLYQDGSFRCGAIILNKRTILTAAHCFKFRCDSSINNADRYEVVVGTHTLRRPSKRAQTAKVEKIIIHPGYNFDKFSEGHDIAVMHLKLPVKLSSATKPVRLSDKTFDKEALKNPNCYVAGLGAKDLVNNYEMPVFLQEKRVQIITNKECDQPTLSSTGLYYDADVNKNHVCTINIELNDVCSGDSGGPMGCYDSNRNFRLIGVVSFYQGPCGIYNAGQKAGYTRVSQYRKWLLANSLGDISI